jgi:hypothetical protein
LEIPGDCLQHAVRPCQGDAVLEPAVDYDVVIALVAGGTSIQWERGQDRAGAESRDGESGRKDADDGVILPVQNEAEGRQVSGATQTMEPEIVTHHANPFPAPPLLVEQELPTFRGSSTEEGEQSRRDLCTVYPLRDVTPGDVVGPGTYAGHLHHAGSGPTPLPEIQG